MGQLFTPTHLILLFIAFGIPCLIVFGVIAIIVKLGEETDRGAPDAIRRYAWQCRPAILHALRKRPSRKRTILSWLWTGAGDRLVIHSSQQLFL